MNLFLILTFSNRYSKMSKTIQLQIELALYSPSMIVSNLKVIFY